MKKGILIATGLALIGAAVYFWKFRKTTVKNNLPEKENERRHLTSIFSKAKKVAVQN